jgi:DNA-binding transcriptional MerR regulator
MKINEVEQIAGISKKNIRFYEEQGLISPSRNRTNGYRQYSEEDVQLLLKIKLLRRLAIPIEEIRKLLGQKLTLRDCLERHQITLQHEIRNLEMIDEMCRSLCLSSQGFSDLSASVYLDELNELEKGGHRFMDVHKVDVSKKIRGAKLSAAVICLLVLGWEMLILACNSYDPAPAALLVFLMALPLVLVGGVLIALKERIKEIKRGEEDDAANY